MMDKYVVMPGCEWPEKPSYVLNFITASKGEADKVAKERNKVEKSKGNKTVTWFVVKW